MMISLDQALNELATISWANNAESIYESLLELQDVKYKHIVTGILTHECRDDILESFFLEIVNNECYAKSLTDLDSIHAQEIILANIFKTISFYQNIKNQNSNQDQINLEGKLSISLLLQAAANEDFKETLDYLPKIGINPFITHLAYLLKNLAHEQDLTRLIQEYKKRLPQGINPFACGLLEFASKSLETRANDSITAYSQLFCRVPTIELIEELNLRYQDNLALEKIAEHISIIGTPTFLSADVRIGSRINAHLKDCMESSSSFIRIYDQFSSYHVPSLNAGKINPELSHARNLKINFLPVNWRESQPSKNCYVLLY